jgi:hypothetical protein
MSKKFQLSIIVIVIFLSVFTFLYFKQRDYELRYNREMDVYELKVNAYNSCLLKYPAGSTGRLNNCIPPIPPFTNWWGD